VIGRAAGIADLVLVDNGGFANIDRNYPRYDREGSQKDPQLRDRAYKGAWFTNLNTALILNITNSNMAKNRTGAFQYMNSHVGKRFPLHGFTTEASLRSLYVSDRFLSHISTVGMTDESIYPNPEGVDYRTSSDIIKSGLY
jgi:hypothetical protein